MSATDTPVADERQLREFGYEQELKRGLSLWSNFAVGFATVSPVVGFYAIITLSSMSAGTAWVWVLPVVLVGQLLIATVYAELASQFPIAGGAYQWARRLLGPGAGWFAGFVYVCALTAALATVAYTGSIWISVFFGTAPSSGHLILFGTAFLLVCLAVNLTGVDLLRRIVNAGITAEIIASVGVGLVLLLFFRNHGFSLLFHNQSSEQLFGGSAFSGFIAALAVGGWAFVGFDACASVSEETRHATRQVPRAILVALVSVAMIVVLNAVAITLSFQDTKALVSGTVIDPVTPTVTGAFGGWAEKPFLAVVLIAFFACGTSVQAFIGRIVYSMARDGVLPGSRTLRRVSRRHVPYAATTVVALGGIAGLFLGLDSAAVGTLIAFGTGGFFVMFAIVTWSALVARITGRWDPSRGELRLGRAGLAMNAAAALWATFEAINVAWPRAVLAPPGAPWWQVWAVILVSGAVTIFALAYMVLRRPQDRLRGGDVLAVQGLPDDAGTALESAGARTAS